MEKLLEYTTSISAPLFDSQNRLHFVSAVGDVCRIEGQAVLTVCNTNGVPNGMACDNDGNLFFCDLAHQALLQLAEQDQVVEFLREYEGKAFKGPNSMAFNQGTLFFTDSGPLGETTLQKPHGSVYAVTNGDTLQPLALECLAHPSGIAVTENGTAIYVAETMTNRILRFVQKPMGVYHYSVFYQFGGSMGPSALAVDQQGNLYVAHYDLASVTSSGKISIVKPDGKLHGEIKVPGPEITGLCFDSEKKFLYITEASTRSLYRVQCTS